MEKSQTSKQIDPLGSQARLCRILPSAIESSGLKHLGQSDIGGVQPELSFEEQRNCYHPPDLEQNPETIKDYFVYSISVRSCHHADHIGSISHWTGRGPSATW